jgi:uncharacterized membrane protein YfcA
VLEVVGILVLFAAGALISTLGAMTGLGGGFLAVPFLLLLWGLGSKEAVLTSLTMILANSTSSSITYLRSKMVDLKVFALLIAPTIPGLFLGWWLLSNLSDTLFKLLFSVFMIGVTIYILVRNYRKERKAKEDRSDPDKDERRLLPHLSIPIAFAAGTVSSAFGIGGGALLMPLQVGLMKAKVKRAIATSMLLIAVMSAFRVIAISRAGFDPFVALPLAAGALLGAQLGAHLVKKVQSRYLLYLMASFLLFIAAYMGVRAILSLA